MNNTGNQMNDMNLLFLGAGHMACAIIDGLLDARLFSPEQITAVGRDRAKLASLQERYGISVRTNADEAVCNADAVILAVPPQALADAIRTNEKSIPSDALIISVCAGISTRKIQSLLKRDPAAASSDQISSGPRIIRVMPNTLGRCGYGFSALYPSASATADDTAFAKKLFSAIGKVLFVPEERFDAFTAFSCTGPAYVLAFMQALIDAGTACGFSEEVARQMVLGNLAGTAEMLRSSGADPADILERMMTAGGITEAAVNILHEGGFPDLVNTAVFAGKHRAEQIGYLLP